MSADEVVFDVNREARIGLEEAVLCAPKSVTQIATIVQAAAAEGRRLLLTRLGADQFSALPEHLRNGMDYCDVSRTACFGPLRPLSGAPQVAVVCAGTSDVPVAREAQRTLRYHGHASTLVADVGVAGLWRLTSRLDELRRHPILIVAAGMDAALASVVGGLVGSVVFAVPTSVGYGVAAGGRSALDSMLSSCAAGVAVFNIDNGYGAACAALRTLHALRAAREADSSHRASDASIGAADAHPPPAMQRNSPWNDEDSSRAALQPPAWPLRPEAGPR